MRSFALIIDLYNILLSIKTVKKKFAQRPNLDLAI